MNFGQAVDVMKAGGRVARAGWNGKNMFLFYVRSFTASVQETDAPLKHIYKVGTQLKCLPFIMMNTAQGDLVPWLASQTDVLGEDWVTA